MRLREIISGLATCLCAFMAQGAGAVENTDFITRLWQMEEGLPHNDVEALAQTRDGYLWVGTQAGLARFDGVRFVVFNTNNAPELGDPRVRALCLMRDGSLWIGTRAGTLARLKDGTFSAIDPDVRSSIGYVFCIYESADGAVWIGTDAGLLRYVNGNWSHFAAADGLLHNSVRSICEHQGQVVVATELGANVFKDGRLMAMDPPGTGPRRYLRALWPDHAGNLWLGFRYGLGMLNPQGEFTLYSREDGLPDENETVLFEDRQANLWIGSMGGLNRLRAGRFSVEQQADGTSYGRVRCVFEDREGIVWVGTRDGLNQLRPRRFRTYTAGDGLAHNNVISVLEDRNGTVWCAMWGGGLASLKHGAIANYSKMDPQPNALTSDNLLAIHEDADGGILVGVDYVGGVYRFADGRFTLPYPPIPGLHDQAIRVIYRDRAGRLWLGVNTGLVLWDTREKWLPGTIVRAIVEDDAGALWVGTVEGLYRRKDDRFTRFTTDDGLSHDQVNCLRPGEPGETWIGTEGGGLNRLKDGKFTAYTTAQGLFSDQIGDMLEDDAGWLWVSSVKGIFRVRKKDFDLLDGGQLDRLRCVSYGREDGLATVQCNDFAKPASWRGRDGRLWFATTKGLAVTHPKFADELNAQPPPVHIEEVIADRQTVYRREGSPESGVQSRSSRETLDTRSFGPGTENSKHTPVPIVRVPPGRGEVEIRFTALSLQVPDRVRFKYKLEESSRRGGTEWVEVPPGRERRVNYNGLEPGRYRFRVAACNSDGVWNETGDAITFILLPRFWQTWWFKPAIAAGLCAAALGLYRVRVARLRQIERLRARIAADLHDDIGSNVASIALLSQLGVEGREVERGNELTTAVAGQGVEGNVQHSTFNIQPATAQAATGPLEEIHRIALQTAANIRETVWFINPDYDTLEEMIARMREVAGMLLNGTECRFDVEAESGGERLSLEFRRNIFLMYKEALHNVARHARASRVDIRARTVGGRFELTISDDGVGFDQSTVSTGSGLKNLRLRMAQSRVRDGIVEIRSEPGRGTTVSLSARIT